jgi:hypothetical protein
VRTVCNVDLYSADYLCLLMDLAVHCGMTSQALVNIGGKDALSFVKCKSACFLMAPSPLSMIQLLDSFRVVFLRMHPFSMDLQSLEGFELLLTLLTLP